jgi:hypothetical protein
MTPRVSTKNKSSKFSIDTTKDDAAFIDDYTNKRKIRRTKASKVEHASAPWKRPGGRGKLKMLPEMPVDILLEVRHLASCFLNVVYNQHLQIFSLLDPLDIMRLSRTTKAIRGILMSRSAIVVWKAAFTREPELPNMPKDMNEPQWANLAFSNHCHASHFWHRCL